MMRIRIKGYRHMYRLTTSQATNNRLNIVYVLLYYGKKRPTIPLLPMPSEPLLMLCTTTLW